MNSAERCEVCGGAFHNDSVQKVMFYRSCDPNFEMEMLIKSDRLRPCLHCVPTEASIIRSLVQAFDKVLEEDWDFAVILWASGAKGKTVPRESLETTRN